MRQTWVHEFIEELILGISVRKQESGVGKEGKTLHGLSVSYRWR